MEKYELVKDIAYGYHEVGRLMKVKSSEEVVYMKYIERGSKIDENLVKAIMKHKSANHPNVIRQKEVVLTPTHLAIAMEYASCGELFKHIRNAGRFNEDDARHLFQQYISGVCYCHAMQICHRELKLENTFLDRSPEPCMKICDYSYSKSVVLHSAPRLRFKTAVYVPPEAFSCSEYDGKMADVWSCGVTLYVLLVGAYPFEDEEDHRNHRKTIKNIMAVQYKIPEDVHISEDCKHLLSRIFVANPVERITIDEIKKHPWFLKNLPEELTETAQAEVFRRENNSTFSLQTVEEIIKIVEDAKTPPPVSPYIGGFGWGENGDAEGQEEEGAQDVVEEEEDEKIIKKMKYTPVEK